MTRDLLWLGFDLQSKSVCVVLNYVDVLMTKIAPRLSKITLGFSACVKNI